ncbi:hypothetical protein [Streptomyces sp. CAU 1734]|uniref:hypothetical protein n=1 Tax=Streptomyces sp. CAU 1734 TaxID=3140360 RepID=UPI003261211C
MADDSGDGTAPDRRICGASATLPLQLTVLAIEIAPDAGAHPLRIMTGLRCGLEAHSTGFHSDLVHEIDEMDAGAVWAHWKDGRPPRVVEILADCESDNGEPEGANEACTLFDGHAGGHSFEFSDPDYDAVLACAERYGTGL